jgi:dihydroorotate dehydrogenase electron transfer subunit
MGDDMFTVRVRDVVKHNRNTATITFNTELRSYPGQFVMLNVFGYEEIPLSMSSPNSVTVRAIGETTKALINIGSGELLGIKGPMGKPFSPANEKALLVAGGIGIAPLLYLHDYLRRKGIEIELLYGAKTSEELVCKDRFENIRVSTDDGSEGFHGNVVELLKTVVNKQDYSKIYCCGPEIMLKKLYDYFKELGMLNRVEFSLERYMRCGVGLCGSCALENGLMVCSNGPVFSADELDW